MTSIAVKNPCRDWRAGHFVVPWLAGAEKVVIRDASKERLRAQIDKPYGDESDARQLAVILKRNVKPGDVDYPQPSDYLDVEASAEPFAEPEPFMDVTKGGGFHLYNNRLNVWFNTSPDAGDKKRSWYAGAATSVILDDKEILDAFRAEVGFLGHDPEKRCMQIDRVRLLLPSGQSCDFWLHAQPWELIGQGTGPARAFATVRSPELRCGGYAVHLVRTISLFWNANYVIEELSLDGETPLAFSARYFTWFDAGLEPVVTHLSHIPDWLAVGVTCAPFQGYGFSCDVHVPRLECAPWGFPNLAFSFELGYGKTAKCLHLFYRGFDGHRLADESGRAWHDHIYKPISGEVRNG
jgi:hypothetical protein